ncbi:CUB domain-containing protein, partial [Endogone sp. FLAS-F59071]
MATPVSANIGLHQPNPSFLPIANPLYVPSYQPSEDPLALSPRPRIQRRQSTIQREQFMGGYCYGQQLFTNATGSLTATAFYSNYSNDMDCVWTIKAPQANEVIKVTFDYFHTECGWDYLTFYDGNSTGAPLLARLCGLRDNYNDTVVSSGNYLTVVFTSDENVDAKGFQANWESVALLFRSLPIFLDTQQSNSTQPPLVPCNYCTQYGNTCSANNTCVCTDKNRNGTLCERNTTGFSGFTPRSFHAAAYDPQRDLMVISGGNSWTVAAMDDVI